MICVFEPVCIQGEHAPFNAALLLSVREIARDGQVAFFGDASHLARVAECLPPEAAAGIQFHPLQVAERHLRAFLPRLRIELPLLSHVWRAARASRGDMLVITGVTEPGLLAIKLFFLLRRPRIPVVLVFHSILPQFLYSLKRRLLLGAFIPRNVNYVVLGKHILQELDRNFPDIRRHMSSISHPYIFGGKSTESRDVAAVPKFAFVGLANAGKGFPEFLRLIEDFGSHAAPADVPPFHLVGRVAPECAALFERFKASDAVRHLWFPSQPGPLPIEVYRQKIDSVDYLLMPYGVETYKLVCSGSSLDALTLLKPIIALRSSFFDVFFEQLGDVGYLCDSPEDMSALIAELIRNPPRERYRLQVENLRKARAFFEPGVVAHEIKLLTSFQV